MRYLLNKLKEKIDNKRFKKNLKNIEIVGNYDWTFKENICLGEYIYIGPNSKFWGCGKVKIKNNVIIGPNITIMTSNHNYQGNSIPYDSINIAKDVVIEDNVWIGANVNIIPGVLIGEGSIIGMGTVVTGDVPKYSIVGGNPSKVIGYRDIEKYMDLKKKGALYFKNKLSEK